jgi:hypothetical protein
MEPKPTTTVILLSRTVAAATLLSVGPSLLTGCQILLPLDIQILLPLNLQILLPLDIQILLTLVVVAVVLVGVAATVSVGRVPGGWRGRVLAALVLLLLLLAPPASALYVLKC